MRDGPSRGLSPSLSLDSTAPVGLFCVGLDYYTIHSSRHQNDDTVNTIGVSASFCRRSVIFWVPEVSWQLYDQKIWTLSAVIKTLSTFFFEVPCPCREARDRRTEPNQAARDCGWFRPSATVLPAAGIQSPSQLIRACAGPQQAPAPHAKGTERS